MGEKHKDELDSADRRCHCSPHGRPPPQLCPGEQQGAQAASCPSPHHVVSWKQLLQKLRLFMLDRFDDEFVVTGYVEEGATGPRVAQLNQRLTAEGVLGPGEKSEKFRNTRGCPCRNQLQMQFCSKEKPEPGFLREDPSDTIVTGSREPEAYQVIIRPDTK